MYKLCLKNKKYLFNASTEMRTVGSSLAFNARKLHLLV